MQHDLHSALAGPVEALERTLERWRRAEYPRKCIPTIPLFVHAQVLTRRYTSKALSRGQAALKGRDAQLAARVAPLCARLGFVLGFARLVHTWSGEENDKDEQYRYYKLSDIVDCAGKQLFAPFDLDLEKAVLPKFAFKGAKADKSEYDSDYGTYHREYQRSAIIIYQQRDHSYIKYRVRKDGGISKSLNALQSSGVLPSPNSQDLAANVLRATRDWRARFDIRFGDGTTITQKDVPLAIMDCATRWGDLALWKRAFAQAAEKSDITAIGMDRIAQAVAAFSFPSLETSFGDLIQATNRLTSRYQTIGIIEDRFYEDIAGIDEWADNQLACAFKTYRVGAIEDVPQLVADAKYGNNLDILSETIIPSILSEQPEGSFEFFVALAESLHENLVFPACDTSVDRAIESCLSAAVPQWSWDPPAPESRRCSSGYGWEAVPAPSQEERASTLAAKVPGLVRLGAVCVRIDAAAPYRALLDSLLAYRAEDAPCRLDALYLPLLPPLLRVHLTTDSPLLEHFKPFLSSVLELLLQHMLHPPSNTINVNSLKEYNDEALECSKYTFTTASGKCADCTPLDEFLQSPTREEWRLASQESFGCGLQHLEMKIRWCPALQELVSCSVVPGPSRRAKTLVVTKLIPGMWKKAVEKRRVLVESLLKEHRAALESVVGVAEVKRLSELVS